jgi:hypothetical protein
VTSLLLISSAAYVEPELEAEFGRLPPAFLPLGNRRLFVHQRMALGRGPARLLLSLPEDFEPEPGDGVHLAELGIEIVKVPPGLSLGQSLVYVINVTAIAGAELSILHGDTLIDGVDWERVDIVSVESTVPPGYHWGYVRSRSGALDIVDGDPEDNEAVALTGYFSFSSASLLVQSVTRASGSFVGGLAGYSQQRPIDTVTAAKWLDFGHTSTYHLSRQAVTTEREFNTLVADRRRITKSGADKNKIEAEARWYEALPPPLRVYTPAFLGMREDGAAASYSIEYLHLPTLSDLFVFGRLPRRAWEQMLGPAMNSSAPARSMRLRGPARRR